MTRLLALLFATFALLATGCASSRSAADVAPPVVDTNWVALADAAYEDGRYATAALRYREAARRDQQAALSWFNFANAMVRIDRTDEAVLAYRRSIAAAPAFLRAHQNLAALLQIKDDLVGAASHYTIAVRLDSSDVDSRYRLGELALKAGDPIEAAQWFERARQIDNQDEGSSSGLVQAWLAAHDTSEADGAIGRFNHGSQDPRAWAQILEADLAGRRGLSLTATTLYGRAAAADSNSTQAFVREARMHARAGRHTLAAIAQLSAVRRAPQDGALWTALGRYRLEALDPLGAREAWKEGFLLGDPGAVDGLEALAAWHERRGEEDAAKVTRAALETP